MSSAPPEGTPAPYGPPVGAPGPDRPGPDPSSQGLGPAGTPTLPWRTALLLASAFVSVLLTAVAMLLPVPYVVLRPGPAINTLGQENGHPLISVTGHQTYPVSGAEAGTLDLTTVTVSGGPNAHLSLLAALAGWFDRSSAVYPQDVLYPPGQSEESSRKENEQEMASSQESATVAALRSMGISVPVRLRVEQVDAGTPPSTLRVGDVVVGVAGQRLNDDATLRTQMAKVAPGATVAVTVVRGDREQVIQAPTRRGAGGRALFGIRVSEDFTVPFQVKIQIDDVGGPSAGMMFALGIIDLLTPGPMTGGRQIAGTGTIDPDGAVGPIGGIDQKLVGARRAGATWFLAPADNCADVRGHVPDGLHVVKVATLADARTAVQRIAAGADPATFTGCG